jgi:hypothetical protein
VPSTFCSYGKETRKEPISTAEAASITTKPPPPGAIGGSLDAQERPGGALFERGACVRRGRRISFSDRLRRSE